MTERSHVHLAIPPAPAIDFHVYERRASTLLRRCAVVGMMCIATGVAALQYGAIERDICRACAGTDKLDRVEQYERLRGWTGDADSIGRHCSVYYGGSQIQGSSLDLELITRHSKHVFLIGWSLVTIGVCTIAFASAKLVEVVTIGVTRS